MDSAISLILSFVEGKIEAREFENKLYSSKEMEEILPSDLYLTIISMNYGDQFSISRIQSELKEYLNHEGIEFTPTAKYKENIELLHKAQPKWLDLTTCDYSEQILENIPPELGKKEVISWLKNEILERFKVVKKAPTWLQEPNWPVENNTPFVFMGQLKIDNYFHDRTCIYVFYNQKTGETKNVIQSM